MQVDHTQIENMYQRYGDVMDVGGSQHSFISLPLFSRKVADVSRLPVCIKLFLENILRNGDEHQAIKLASEKLSKRGTGKSEVAFSPNRVLMHDTTGTPCLVDLAGMRTVLEKGGFDSKMINPLRRVDINICHSNAVDAYAKPTAFEENLENEFSRNHERYVFFRWAESAFQNLRIIPPGRGICHQNNLEHLSTVVDTSESNGSKLVFPDSLVCTDSHTPMINALGVLAWGVGGLEGEAVALGESVRILVPRTIGVKLTGTLSEKVVATDLALKLTEILRNHGVVDSFLEFYGSGVSSLSLFDRATISNMSPEYGSTVTLFPIDDRTIDFLTVTGRSKETIHLVERYAKAQGLWFEKTNQDPIFDEIIELDLSEVKRAIAGPSHPEARHDIDQVAAGPKRASKGPEDRSMLLDGDILIAAITSCTNAGNPETLAYAGLLAQKAVILGLHVKPWVKTSLSPASEAVGQFLKKSGLLEPLERLGFNITGFGCATCIGNSGSIPEEIRKKALESKIKSIAVLSGNRNFDGRINPDIDASYLMSPALVVAYALAGSITWNPQNDALGKSPQGKNIFLSDIWPESQEVRGIVNKTLSSDFYSESRTKLYTGTVHWLNLPIIKKETFSWDPGSNYLKFPSYLDAVDPICDGCSDIIEARPLVISGDNVTTDHISPAGAISIESSAGKYLAALGTKIEDFNVYAARRGDCEVMARGTFANTTLENMLTPKSGGGETLYIQSGDVMPIYEAAMRYKDEGISLVVIAGKNYGCGSSRDWAAKGVALLGVRAVLAESFERIHRENLVRMGVLPIVVLRDHRSELSQTTSVTITGLEKELAPHAEVELKIKENNRETTICGVLAVYTETEMSCIKHGGMLPKMIRGAIEQSTKVNPSEHSKRSNYETC